MADDSHDATTTPIIPSDIPAAIAFLKIFSPIGPWRVFRLDLDSKPAISVRSFTDEDQLRQHLAANSGRFNLYFCPNPLAGHVQTTPRRDQVTGIHSLYCDLDLPSGQEQSVTNFQTLLDKINDLSPSPTMIVATGGGLQAYWFLPRPVSFVDQADIIQRAETVGRSIAQSLGADPVQNINRILRIPGTVNLPTPSKIAKGRQPALAKLLHYNADLTWSLDDPVPHPRSGTTALPPPDRNNNTHHNNTGNSAHHTIDDLSKKWQYRIKSGDPSDYDNDRSRLVAALIRHLLNLSWSPDEILPFLADPKYGASAHCRSQPGNPYDTARRQIERVMALMAGNFKVNRNGVILDSDPHNIALACHKLNIEFRYNEFDQRIYYSKATGLEYIDDAEMEVLGLDIYKQFGFWPQQRALWRFVTGSAQEHKFHPVREHLQHLETLWQQKNQQPQYTEQWLIQLAGAPNTPLVRAQSQLILIAAVRRIRSPGCKFDEMIVLQGIEGTNKSSALERLATLPEYFSDNFPLNERSAQRVQERLRGKWIVECSELAGYDQADSEHFKSMLSRTNDSVRQAYGRLPINSLRQCVFFGSTNEARFLHDESNRRIWPVPVGSFDLAALDACLDDLWGEAAFLESTGMSIRLDPSLWPSASEQQQEFRVKDPWIDQLIDKFSDLQGFVKASDCFLLLGNNQAMARAPNANRRLMRSMTDRDLGFVHKRRRVDGQLINGFWRGNEDRWIYVYLEDPTLRTYKASSTEEEEAEQF